jgi:hypothetical protein
MPTTASTAGVVAGGVTALDFDVLTLNIAGHPSVALWRQFWL